MPVHYGSLQPKNNHLADQRPSRVILGAEWDEYPFSTSPHLAYLADIPGWSVLQVSCVHNGDFHLCKMYRGCRGSGGHRLQEKWGHQLCTVGIIQKQAQDLHMWITY